MKLSENFKAWVSEETLYEACSLAGELGERLSEKGGRQGASGFALLLVAGACFNGAPLADEHIDELALEMFRTGRVAARAANGGGAPKGSA